METELRACSKCRKQHNRIVGGKKPRVASYCNECHADYMRPRQRAHAGLSAEERMKANARSYANVYQRRGVLQPRPCESCGGPHAEKHHEDYRRPLEVEWLCKLCHAVLHQSRQAA